MKTVKRIFALLSMVVFIEGCKDDEPAPNPSAELIGNWEFVSYETTECSDPDDNYKEICDDPCPILEITATTVTFDADDGDGPYNYTTNGNSITITLGSGLFFVYTYSISGGTLTISAKDSPADGGCKNVVIYKKL